MEKFLFDIKVRKFEELVKCLFASHHKIEQFCRIT